MALCKYHPDRPGVGVCMRCRAVICAACCTRLEGINHCHACLKALAARPVRRRRRGAMPLAVLVLYAIAAGLGYRGYFHLPVGFIPPQDKGYLIASIQLPDAASAERTQAVIDKLAEIALSLEVDVPAQPGEPGAVADRAATPVG